MLTEITADNFPNLDNERETCLEEAFRSPRCVQVKRPTARHIVVKLAKMNDKERILRAARQKKIIYKGTPIRLSADFSTETLQARREWNDIFKTLKDKNRGWPCGRVVKFTHSAAAAQCCDPGR